MELLELLRTKCGGCEALCEEAADEIERLRTALQEIADGADAKAFVKATALKALAG